jgi:hypothetical protein
MRPRTISLVVTLGIFLGGLALVWALTGGHNKRSSSSQSIERLFTFPLNSTSKTVSVRSPWKLGHMTPQDDQVELTLEGGCATAHLYAYLSKGWDHGPLNAASVILGLPLHPSSGAAPRVVRSNATSAIVVSRTSGRGVLVTRAAARDYNALLVLWETKPGCNARDLGRTSRELGRLFETFKVGAPAVTGSGAAYIEIS